MATNDLELLKLVGLAKKSTNPKEGVFSIGRYTFYIAGGKVVTRFDNGVQTIYNWATLEKARELYKQEKSWIN